MIPARAGKLRAFQYSQSYTRSAARDGGVSFPSGCRVSVLRRLRSQTRVDPSRVERPFRFKLVDPSRYSDSSRPRAPREPYARYVWNVCAYRERNQGRSDCPRRPVYGRPYAARVRDRGPGLVEEPHAARDETSTAEAAQTHVSNRNRVNYRVVRDALRTSRYGPRGRA